MIGNVHPVMPVIAEYDLHVVLSEFVFSTLAQFGIAGAVTELIGIV
jgi:hypothetical protein